MVSLVSDLFCMIVFLLGVILFMEFILLGCRCFERLVVVFVRFLVNLLVVVFVMGFCEGLNRLVKWECWLRISGVIVSDLVMLLVMFWLELLLWM